MIKGISIITKHYAHLNIHYNGNERFGNGIEDVEQITTKVLEVFDNCKVSIDTEFKCNALTEVGLIGSCLESVKSAAILISRLVDEHETLEMLGV